MKNVEGKKCRQEVKWKESENAIDSRSYVQIYQRYLSIKSGVFGNGQIRIYLEITVIMQKDVCFSREVIFVALKIA